MDEQNNNINKNNSQRLYRWMADSLYPIPKDQPRTFAELAERVVREVQDLRSRTSPGGEPMFLRQELDALMEKTRDLKKQRDGFAAANAELGLLLQRDEDQEHKNAEQAMALIRERLAGGVIVGVAKNEDTASFGLVVHVPEGHHVRLWLYRDERKAGAVQVELEEEPDA